MVQKNSHSQNTVEIQTCCDSLYYLNNGSWSPLPEWAKSFLKLGLSLSQFSDDKRRFVVAIAVPTRAYASLLVAGGISCGRSTISNYETDHEHLEKILSLPSGTSIIYIDSGKKKHAIIRDLQTYDGVQRIGVQLDSSQTRYISFNDVGRIQVSDKSFDKLPKQQKGQDIPPPSSLIQNFVGKDNVQNFIMRTQLENALIGSSRTLREEMQLNLSVRNSSAIDCPGQFSDLLRVKEYQPNGVAFRTSIIPAAGKGNTKAAGFLDPFTVIFDGSQGFLKWRDYWRNSNWIIILDRTEPNFEHSAEHVNQEYLNRSEKPLKITMPSLATGVELMLFGVDK